MSRISISFEDETYKKLKQRADNKKISIAQYTRELVDIGLRVEETAEQNPGDNAAAGGELAALGELKPLVKNTLLWTLEARSMLRYLIQNLNVGSKEEHEKTLNLIKEKTKSSVAVLLQEDI